MTAAADPAPAETGAAFDPPGTKAEVEEGAAFMPRFGADGLLTCVTVEAGTGAVLMVAHMNAEALARTLETGEAWYWSRSRAELWHKGATSGQVQRVVALHVDCDQDALVLTARVGGDGGCCHTGRHGCFYRRVVVDPLSGRARLVAHTQSAPLTDG
jgi:phosphoribosyl-AMP cyclohydrolase